MTRPLIHCESFGGRGSRGLRKNAKVEGYAIGGKTATSQTLPRSDNVYIASFLGFYPVDDPALMVLVKINNQRAVHTMAEQSLHRLQLKYLGKSYRMHRR